MSLQIFHWISVPILAELSGRSEKKIRKIYRSVITNECVPLSEIPRYLMDKYLCEYLLRDRLIDFSFMDAIKKTDDIQPLRSPEVQELFREMKMLREGAAIFNAYSANGTSTKRLKELAAEYGISYSTCIVCTSSEGKFLCADMENTRSAKKFKRRACDQIEGNTIQKQLLLVFGISTID